MAGRALDRHFAVRRVQDAARDGQAEACSALAAFRRHERLEDAADHVRRDPFAVVFDPDDDVRAIRLRVDPDVAVVADGVAGVEEDVGQNLLQVMKVSLHLGVGHRRDMHVDVLRLEEVFVQSDRCVDELRRC